MKKIFFLVLLLCFVGTKSFAIDLHPASERLADVSLITVHPGVPNRFQAISDHGFIVVALRDCALLINGRTEVLHAADFRRVEGKRVLELSSTSTLVSLTVITIRNAQQNLTIHSTVLAHREELEDASDRNASLLIGISAVQLADVRDQNAEGEAWKSESPSTIKLSAGQTAWLKPGMHRIRNLADSAAHFVTIEW